MLADAVIAGLIMAAALALSVATIRRRAPGRV